MRILGIHSDYCKVITKEKAIEGADSLKEEDHVINIDHDCMVIYIAVEKADETSPESVAYQLVANIKEKVTQLAVKDIVLYPYVHLTDNPCRPRIATMTLQIAREALEKEYHVVTVPFGWYKAFEISCKGHPLSEWSARFVPGKEKAGAIKGEKRERKSGSEFVRWIAVDLDGREYEITADDFRKAPVWNKKEDAYKILKQFIANEFGFKADTKQIPKHILYMQQHELVDYCDVSEKGHYKWYPKGFLIQRLILDYGRQIANEWGALEMKNPIIIKGDSNVVGQLMGEFHERDYQVDGGRGTCYLRYASDPLGFPFMQKVRFTCKQSPLKVYEEASCFRNEQEGEVSGLKRVRNFMMTDMHAACATVEEALKEFRELSIKFAGLMNTIIAKGRWVLGWEGTVDFYEQNKEYLINIGKEIGVPAFFKLMPEMSHYYAIKNEFQSITEDKSTIQVSTVQWDVKDGPRFNIGFIDDKGEKHPCPVIIHASSFGSIERTLCTLLENIAIDVQQQIPAMFPYWISPTQARIIPVSDKFLDVSIELCHQLNSRRIRCDVDDRDETVGKKIREGEKNWIPYLLVIGQREQDTQLYTVRVRKNNAQIQMKLEEFIDLTKEEQKGLPWRPLPTPVRVTQGPVFFG